MSEGEKLAEVSTRKVSEGEKLADALLPLLREYTERLRVECERYLNRPPLQILTTSLAFLGFILGMIGAFKLGWKDIPRDLSDVKLVAVGVIGMTCFIYGTVYSLHLRQKDILTRYELRRTAARLRKIVLLGSQVEDHSVEDLGTRTQLQLRLADGEAALELADIVIDDTGSILRKLGIIGTSLRIEVEHDRRARSVD